MAWAICTSSVISVDQPPFVAGSGLVLPFSSSLRKQPFAVVHAGRPNSLSYTPRSASAVGSLYASTTAIVCWEEGNVAPGSEYAACSCAGVSPSGFGVLLVTAGLAPLAASAACLVAFALRSAPLRDTDRSLIPRQPAEPGWGRLHSCCARNAERDRDADAAGLSADASAAAHSRATAIRAARGWW